MSIIPLNWHEHYTHATGSEKATADRREFWTPVSFPAPRGFGRIEARVKRSFFFAEPKCSGPMGHAWREHATNSVGPTVRVYHACNQCGCIRETGPGAARYTSPQNEEEQMRAIKSKIAAEVAQ